MTRTAQTERRVKMSIEVPETIKRLIEELRVETGADSMTEVIRRALQLYAHATRVKKVEGRTLFIRDADGTERELLLVGVGT